MKIYLDNCALQRPLDDKAQIRIRLEAEAILSILEQCQTGEHDLISSEILVLELGQTPLELRREYGGAILETALSVVELDETIEQRANTFVGLGIKALDALHLASAESGSADYFCTCDDRFLRRARTISDLKLTVVTPLELIQELSAL